jgi:KDO2-lipid IV(A) lauroyltransferase
VRLTGALDELEGREPTVIFWPHFVGMDAGWTALTLRSDRPLHDHLHAAGQPGGGRVDPAGPQRFGNVRPVRPRRRRQAGGQRAARGRAAVPAARHELRPRGIDLRAVLRRAGGDGAVALAVRPPGAGQGGAAAHAHHAEGYDVQVLPAWRDYPTDDLEADTA